MRNALPVITEDTATLKQRLHHEHDGRKKPRLQMLWLCRKFLFDSVFDAVSY